MKTAQWGEWLAVLGFIVAVLAGLASGAGALSATYGAWVAVLLVILGIVIGLTTITEKEVTSFLIATIALSVGAGGAFTALNTLVAPLGTVVTDVFRNVVVLIAPAAMIVGVKAIYSMASRK